MNTIVFKLRTSHEASFAISNFLQANGALGITVVDKVEFLQTINEQSTADTIAGEFIEALSDEVVIESYFNGQDDRIQINQKLDLLEDSGNPNKVWISINDFEERIKDSLERASEFVDIGFGYVSHNIVKEEDWSEKWKEYYDTLKIGRIVINPSWIDYQEKPDEIVLQLDPGSAFGTGSHESTSLVLQYLSDYDFKELQEGAVLDLGTGSGILAIAASKIFPRRKIEAIDIDQQALDLAKLNAEKNQANIAFSLGELWQRENTYSLILANLIADIHLDLAEEYLDKLKDKGFLIASGIVASRANEVKEKFASLGIEIIDQLYKNDWYTFLGWLAP